MSAICSWCRLRHQKRIKALNVVIVEGLTQSDFYNHFLSLRRLRTNHTTVSGSCPVRETIVARPMLLGLQRWLIFPPIRGSPSLHQLHRWRLASSPVKCLSQMHCLHRRDAVRAVSCTKVRKHICTFLHALWFASNILVVVLWKKFAVACHSRPWMWMFWRFMVDFMNRGKVVLRVVHCVVCLARMPTLKDAYTVFRNTCFAQFF